MTPKTCPRFRGDTSKACVPGHFSGLSLKCLVKRVPSNAGTRRDTHRPNVSRGVGLIKTPRDAGRRARHRPLRSPQRGELAHHTTRESIAMSSSPLPGWVPLLESVLRQSPALPRALCRDQPDLFDASDKDRLAEAIALCHRCPDLAPCRAWIERQPDSAVSGVIAGELREWVSHPSQRPKRIPDPPPPKKIGPVGGSDVTPPSPISLPGMRRRTVLVGHPSRRLAALATDDGDAQ